MKMAWRMKVIVHNSLTFLKGAHGSPHATSSARRAFSRSFLVTTLLVIGTLALTYSIQPVKAEPGNIIASYGQGYLENVDGVLVLHVKGSPYEMGYQHGFLLRDSVQAAIQYDKERWLHLYERRVEYAHRMEPYMPQEYVQEMQGLADGAGMNYSDVLINECSESRVLAEVLGCSGFVVFGNATADGHLYHGRNDDYYWPPEMIPVKTGLVIVYEPESGNRYVTVGSEPFGKVGTLSGMNDQGISLGMTGSRSQDVSPDGMPFFLMIKQVLQYSNSLTEALDAIRQTPRTVGLNILLGDSETPNGSVVEISANHSKVFWPGDPAEDVDPHYGIPNAVRRANHYVDPELAATQRDPYDPRVDWNWSWDRYEKLGQLIEEDYGTIDAEKAMEFMQTPPVAWDPISMVCMLFHPADLELWVACANSTTPAYEREFIHLSRDVLFPGFDLTISSTAGGNVTDPGEGTFAYDQGAVIDLVAEAEEGYHFVEWTGDVSTIADAEDATTIITMEDDYEITANFEADAPGLCFIATGAYGTPMAHEVQTLREFRDEYMLTNPPGQAFVDFYYRVSPPIAKFITQHPGLKPIIRATLVPAVAVSTVAVNTTLAGKASILGFLLLASVAVAILLIRRRGRGPEYS